MRICNYPFFLPADCVSARERFQTAGDVSAGIRELIRLARVGASGARSALAFAVLSGALRADTPDAAIAGALCRQAAFKGDAYAQYVMGWVAYGSGEGADVAVGWWTRSADQNFSPAWMDLGRILGGAGEVSPRFREAMFAFNKAASLGHRFAGLSKAALVRRVGWIGRILSYSLVPIGYVTIQAFVRYQPYSEGSLAFFPKRRQPFFVDAATAAAILYEGLPHLVDIEIIRNTAAPIP